MDAAIDFTGRVAIVTGAGGGLGRAYAMALAARGAHVVINDPGVARDGTGTGGAAGAVVDAIIGAGGSAMADTGSVTDADAMAAMVAGALERWGRIDICINNAGILRDKSFAKMTIEDFLAVTTVHLTGAAIVTRAVWDPMRAAGHGRILMTTSSSGLFGNFGQANYAAAKMGLVGLAKTLDLEGVRHGIRVNCLAPVAGTRMTADLFPEALYDRFTPDSVVPTALYLVSDAAPGGLILGAGAGVVHAAQVVLTKGAVVDPADGPDAIAAAIEAICDRQDASVPASGAEQTAAILSRISS